MISALLKTYSVLFACGEAQVKIVNYKEASLV